MELHYVGQTDQGLVRSANQDAYAIDEPQGRFFIVADGMGGHAGGQEASRLATETIQAYLNEHWQDGQTPADLLETALFMANQRILEEQLRCPELGDMGTTVVVVIFPEGERPWCTHVGDSRLYRLRDEQLEQISQDHTWISQAVKAGSLTPEEARLHPWRHILSQCLGREDLHKVESYPLDVQPGDRLLLCSDGLTEEVPDQLIATHLKTTHDKAAIALIEAAKDHGGRDNITVVIVDIGAN